MMPKSSRHTSDYRLNVFHHVDDQSGQRSVRFVVRTVQEFVSFNYQVLLDVRVDNGEVLLKITGIHAPVMVMPGIGPARGFADLTGLKGSYGLTINKLKKEVNRFQIEVTDGAVRILKSPSKPFILVSPDPIPLT
ncbi:MAG: hypothetical protein WD295_06210 [Bacteroidota bacterium]